MAFVTIASPETGNARLVVWRAALDFHADCQCPPHRPGFLLLWRESAGVLYRLVSRPSERGGLSPVSAHSCRLSRPRLVVEALQLQHTRAGVECHEQGGLLLRPAVHEICLTWGSTATLL